MALPISKDTPATIQEFLESRASRNLYLVVYASPLPATGQSWCGDCRRAEPLVNEKFVAAGLGKDVKVVFVGSSVEWRTPTNAWRQKPFSIERLPTIVKVTDKGKWERLVEGDCYDQKKLEKFVG